MKKEFKRYYLTAYAGKREKIVQTNEEIEKLVKEVEKYNKRVNSKYLYGNITISREEDGIHLISHLYTKLSKSSTITDILDLVSSHNKDSIIQAYLDKCGMKPGYIPDINIAYFESKDTKGINKVIKNDDYYLKGIKYLPMLFKEDRKYMSLEYLNECLEYHAKNGDYNFFKGLAYEFSLHHPVSAECDGLWQAVDKVEHQGYESKGMYILGKNLINQYTLERDKNGVPLRNENGEYIRSKRRLLDAGMYVKYYGVEFKKNSPLQYNEGPTEKKKKELELEEKRSKIMQLINEGKAQYEQLKLF